MRIGLITPEYILNQFDRIQKCVEIAFDQSVNEEKIISKDLLILSNSALIAKTVKKETNLGNSGGYFDDQNKIVNCMEKNYRKDENQGYNNIKNENKDSDDNKNTKNSDDMNIFRYENNGSNDSNKSNNNNTSRDTIDNNDGNKKHKNHEINNNNDKKKPDTMRKSMTRLYDEILHQDIDVVYIGEDVEHGGYYLVTDGLAKKYPLRSVCLYL